ncbi:MAG: DPP IV N-terminal domain-containing protein [Planctomycetota bacterium]
MPTLSDRRLVLLAGLAATSLLLAPDAHAQRRTPRSGSGGAQWAHDGRHLVLGDRWIDPATGEEVDPVPAPEAAATPDFRAEFVADLALVLGKAPSPTALRGTAERSTLPRQPIEHPGVHMTADGKRGATVLDGVLYAWESGKGARRVREGLAGARRFEIAPDGSSVSCILGYDLHIVRLDDGETTRVSEDGGENLFYGELDWVYQEEVYGRYEFKATWWAPTGAHLAFLRIEEEGVDTFTVVDHTQKTLNIEELKYPKAGTTNPRASLHLCRAEDGARTQIDLSAYPASAEILIVDVDWTPSGDRVVCLVQNREQTWLDLVFADPSTGESTVIVHEECTDGWVNRPPLPRWLADGTFLWESERTGYKHIDRYQPNGTLVAAVTSGEWEVRSLVRLDEERGFLVVSGSAPDYAIGSHAYLAKLDGSSIQKITDGRGTHSVSVDAGGTFVIDSFQSMVDPGQQWLRSTDGKIQRELARAPAREGLVLPVWEQIEARDGEWIDVAYTLPEGFDASRKYPVWIDTYSGPDAATIRDVFRPSPPSDWYILLRVNVRSASGRGMRYTKACYRQFGVQELRDIEDAVDWICKNDWADAERVGITGWSYGGFMTAFAMTHSTKFKCGIAGAGVYDWELYDTIYTERYMATPQNNPAGYAASSVVKAAKNLSGHMLIVHGTMDDNVHMQNAILLVDELQKAGKQNFEFMLYPRARHGVGSPHLRALRERFMRERL